MNRRWGPAPVPLVYQTFRICEPSLLAYYCSSPTEKIFQLGYVVLHLKFSIFPSLSGRTVFCLLWLNVGHRITSDMMISQFENVRNG